MEVRFGREGGRATEGSTVPCGVLPTCASLGDTLAVAKVPGHASGFGGGSPASAPSCSNHRVSR